jgi:hypothetical protein
VDAGHLGFEVAEFSAGRPVVLGAGVEPVDLNVGGVGDERDLLDREFLGQRSPGAGGLRDGSSRVSDMWSPPWER